MNHIKLPVFLRHACTCTCIENFNQIEIYKFADQCLFDIKDYVYSRGEKIPLKGTQNYLFYIVALLL